ncbi:MAG: hypothetical protein SNG10_07100 [Rikenellaceae bacterium]
MLSETLRRAYFFEGGYGGWGLLNMGRWSLMVMFRLLLLMLFLATGCSPCREVALTRRDSVSIESRSRQVEIVDTLFAQIFPVEDRVTERSDSSYLENRYARSEAIILHSGELYHTLESIPQLIEVEYRKSVEVRDSVIYRDRSEVKVVEVERKLSWWQMLQIRGFWALVSLLGGGIVVRKILG